MCLLEPTKKSNEFSVQLHEKVMAEFFQRVHGIYLHSKTLKYSCATYVRAIQVLGPFGSVIRATGGVVHIAVKQPTT